MVKITVKENGPYVIETDSEKGFEVRVGDRVETLERKAIALCRCGHSANKPFCDGAHKKHEFQAGGGEILPR